MTTIPNAQTAVTRTSARWVAPAVGRSCQWRRLYAKAAIAATAAAANAGAREPVGPSSVRRTGAAAVAAPYAPYARPIAVGPGRAFVPGRDAGQGDRQDDARAGHVDEPAGEEERAVRQEQAAEAGQRRGRRARAS